jgi:sugar transferase (PEP-CTERM/EpsH1 system associated)
MSSLPGVLSIAGTHAPGRRRPRVVHVIPSLRMGGLENIAARLVRHLDSRYEQAVVTPGAGGPVAQRLPVGVRVVAMGEQHRPDRWTALRMAGLFRAIRPDIVHTRNWTCIDAILGAWLARVPVVIHGEHGRDALDPEGRNRKRRRIRRLLAPLVTQFATVSVDLARWLVEDVGIPARKVLTICNGVDTERFAPGDRAAARQTLRIPPGSTVVGTVGRLDPVKDQVGLIQAFARTPRDIPSLLVIAGDGPCRAELDAVARAVGCQDRVRFLGEREDVPQVLRALDMFVLPSLGEGISNAILEAMATALPVVASRVGGNGELVKDGENGLLVEARCAAGLAAAIGRYLTDPGLAVAHGSAGRARVEREFSLERMLASYDELYRRFVPLEEVARP